MKDNLPNLNGFPTDNSPSTQLKYDIITSKFMSGIENHNRRNSLTPSFSASMGLVGAILQLAVVIIVIFGLGLKWLWNRL